MWNIKLRIPRYSYIILFLLNGIFMSQAQVDITDDLKGQISLRPYAELFKAGQNTYTIAEILRQPNDVKFFPLKSSDENMGFSNENFWMRFQLSNQTEHTVQYYLETGRPITDLVSLYLKDGSNEITKYTSGDAIPFKDKSVLHRKSVFRIVLRPAETIEAYIHLKSDGEVVMLPLNLIPENIFLYSTYKEQLFYGFFYGILVLACIIYLFFYSAMRDSAFAYYGLYVLFIAVLQFSLDGLSHQYLLPSAGYLSKRAVLFSALISLYFFVNYGRKFLDIKSQSTLLYNSFRAMAGITLLSLFCLLLVPRFLVFCYPVANVIGLIVLVQIVGAIIFLRVKRVAVDYFFIVGVTALVAGFVIFILNNLHVLPNSFFTQNGAKFGIGLEIIFLSLSMGNRIRTLRQSNEKNQILAFQRLEDMNDMKSSFISNISHELRTPLNLIMGVATNLKESISDKEQQEKCKLMLSSSETLLGHVDDILDFTIIEKGEQELYEGSFDLQQVLDRIARVNKKKAQSKSLDLNYTFREGMPETIIGDKTKLVQVLHNLLDNAVKFTSAGQIDFHVDYCMKKDNSVTYLFSIKDTGMGISKEKMSTIFESFTKKSSSDKREFYGLGLGLYVAKSYVDLQNGKIDVRNGARGGTVCSVELNFKLDREQTLNSKHGPCLEHTEGNIEDCNILLVEDNKMNQKVIALLVKKWGEVTLHIANNGQEALEMIKRTSFDIILMDLQMPIMDGFETTALIRSGKAGKNAMEIPIVVVTADVTDATKKEILRLGANDLMTKPIKADLLFGKIVENLAVAER